MGTIFDNLKRVRAQIDASCHNCGRNPHEVGLLAVSKNFGSEAVRDAYAAGQRSFGENYVQEGVDKIAQLTGLPGLEWHMVGPIQSNKTRLVAQSFDWVQSLDRVKTAQRLNEQRLLHLPRLQVCMQINIDAGANKSGAAPEEAMELAQAIAQLPRLQLRGIMVVPEPAINYEAAYALFIRSKALFVNLQRAYPEMDTLSMGMSADLAAAVAGGSTMVRVGTAIFGQRAAHSNTAI
jgi:PLP dependent protein